MHRRVQDRFIILFPAEDALWVFGEKLKLSCIAALPQAHLRPRLILNLLAQPNKVTPSVNDITYSGISPESIQFRMSFLRILQAI